MESRRRPNSEGRQATAKVRRDLPACSRSPKHATIRVGHKLKKKSSTEVVKSSRWRSYTRLLDRKRTRFDFIIVVDCARGMWGFRALDPNLLHAVPFNSTPAVSSAHTSKKKVEEGTVLPQGAGGKRSCKEQRTPKKTLSSSLLY